MAATRDPQPGHPLVAGLDKVFTGPGGNAPALVGWLEYLAHPEMHTGPRRLAVGYAGETEIESRVADVDTPESGPVYTDLGSILRDLDIAEFFAHADVLSGQQVCELNENGEPMGKGALKDVYDLIAEARYRKLADSEPTPGRPEDSVIVHKHIVSASTDLFTPENWEGQASEGAKVRFGQMEDWYEVRTDDLGQMMTFLPRFAAIIHRARMDVNNLMGKLVGALEQWLAEAAVDATFFPSLLKEIIGAITAPPTGASAVQMFLDLLNKGLGAAKEDKENGSTFSYDGSESDGVYRMLESFITAGNEICNRAADAIDGTNTTGKGDGLVDGVGAQHGGRGEHWKEVPDWSRPLPKEPER